MDMGMKNDKGNHYHGVRGTGEDDDDVGKQRWTMMDIGGVSRLA